ncbi:hypothetical protein, partial [Aeromonas rivuli]|uniref:hypothetical protein n=1 Tax=Aeromonas rivuli TaxID=648794 RepID=UPI0005A74BFB
NMARMTQEKGKTLWRSPLLSVTPGSMPLKGHKRQPYLKVSVRLTARLARLIVQAVIQTKLAAQKRRQTYKAVLTHCFDAAVNPAVFILNDDVKGSAFAWWLMGNVVTDLLVKLGRSDP